MTHAYDKYRLKVIEAKEQGFENEHLILELQRERTSIMPRCQAKQMTLVNEKTRHKSREAMRAAQECIEAIDKIIEELSKKESIV